MTLSEAVLVVPFLFGGKLGYDLIVADSRASVHDYLDALNRAIGQLSLSCFSRPGEPAVLHPFSQTPGVSALYSLPGFPAGGQG